MGELDIQARYDELEREKANLNLNSNDDKFQLKRIENEQAELIQQLDPQERLTFLQKILDEVNSQEDVDVKRRKTLLNEISQIEWEIEQQQTKQEREQNQVDQKEAFALPKDYNALFDDSRANDEISNLIHQVIDQLNGFHDGQYEKFDVAYQAKFRVLTEQAIETENQLAAERLERQKLQEDYDKVIEKDHEKDILIHNLEERANDAESKRDASMRLVDSLKDQVKELEQRLESSKPKKSGGFQLNLSSNLSDDNPKIKTARELAMERLGLMPPTLPLIQSEEPITEEQFRNGMENVQAESTLVQEDAGGNQVSEDAEKVHGAEDPVTRAEFEALKADVEALKLRSVA